uniref:Uncharacterized protein n=1 Tax=Tetradesmus obliquus TaxID=3088 RepID=A0A383VIZ8_TETOB|eukprot:jgi/Sobl393_1/5963/SZX65498.1
MGTGDGYAAAMSAAGRACHCPTQAVETPCSNQPRPKRQQQKIGVHSLRKCSVVLQLVFLLLTYATLPGVLADDVSCQQPPSLSIEAQKPADQCQGSLDGSSTRIVTNLTYTASMTGNGDTAPTFETFFDGEASSCEPEVVGEFQFAAMVAAAGAAGASAAAAAAAAAASRRL